MGTPSNNDPPPAPLVDVGGGTMVPAFSLSPDVDPSAPEAVAAEEVVSSSPPPSPQEIADAASAALLKSPDVASYTVNGETVVRRSVADQLELLRAMDQRAARARGIRQTLVDFT